MVINIEFDNDEIISTTTEPDETEARLEENRERIERLGTLPSERDEE